MSPRRFDFGMASPPYLLTLQDIACQARCGTPSVAEEAPAWKLCERRPHEGRDRRYRPDRPLGACSPSPPGEMRMDHPFEVADVSGLPSVSSGRGW